MPAADAMIRVRIDQETKTEAAAILEAVGLTLSDAVRLMLRKTVREKELPFHLSPNAETLAAIQELEAGGGKSFASFADLLADLEVNDDDEDD